MKRFLAHTLIFLLLVAAAFLYVLSRANGYTDQLYLRFTSPKQSNLIIGTSRAAQGIQPRYLKEVSGLDFYNYAFTITHSPYGPTYLNSIQKKLDRNTKNGVFIVAVDPWSISSKTHDPNDSLRFREKDLALGNTPFVNVNPNPFYLMQNLDGKYLQLLNKQKNFMVVKDDGWLEVWIDLDPEKFKERLKIKISDYQKYFVAKYQFSSYRLMYLKKTIEFLQKHGKVYLVRLPIHPEMQALEDGYMPQFDSIMNDLSNISDQYIDLKYLNDSVNYTDGNHIHRESGIEVSKRIANEILVE